MRLPFMRRRPSPAMGVAFLALVLAVSGTAVALPGRNTVDSGDLKRGAVKSTDIGRGAVTSTKLRNGAVTNPKLRNGAVSTTKLRDDAVTGAKIAEGSLGTVPTAANATQLGGKAPSGYLQFGGTIPAGTTVIGNWYAAPSADSAGALGFDEVDLPAFAPVALTDETANMGAGTTNGGDNDATCTGTAEAPTAPAGKMCFYVGFQTGLTELQAFISNGPPTTGAAVRVTGGAGGGSEYARGGWAYTAP